MVLKEFDRIKVKGCACGRDHVLPLDRILVGSGVITETPQIIKEYKAKKVSIIPVIRLIRIPWSQTSGMWGWP